jgi:hypothetical protein
MTPDMNRKLDELGFSQLEGDNFFRFIEPSNFPDLQTAADCLGAVLHDVYGVSAAAALEVSVSLVEPE